MGIDSPAATSDNTSVSDPLAENPNQSEFEERYFALKDYSIISCDHYARADETTCDRALIMDKSAYPVSSGLSSKGDSAAGFEKINEVKHSNPRERDSPALEQQPLEGSKNVVWIETKARLADL